MSLLPRSRWGRRTAFALLGAAVVAGVVAVPATAQISIDKVRSEVTGSDGKDYWVENNLTPEARQQSADGPKKEYAIVWAGDENVADTAVADVRELPGSLTDPID
jgi:hypothetical protein